MNYASQIAHSIILVKSKYVFKYYVFIPYNLYSSLGVYPIQICDHSIALTF